MLILKENAANSVPTPPVGKDTFFIDDSGTPSIKNSGGTVSTFPTVGAANAQVLFMNGSTISGENAFTYDFNNNILTVSGNIAAGNIKTDNLLYSNGTPWDFVSAAGANTQIQFSNGTDLDASANFVFNKTTNTLTLTGTANVTDMNASGNAIIGGNLTVNGNVVYVNVETLDVEDPIISLGGGPNGAAPVSDDGKDRGTALQYFSSSAKTAFMGWDNSNAEFGMGSVVSITNEVVTWTSYGNLRVGNIIGNGQALSGITGANVTGTVPSATSASTAGTVTANAQPNITSVGTLTGLTSSGNVTANNLNATTYVTATGIYANSGTVGAQFVQASYDVTATRDLYGGNVYANSGIVGANTGNFSGNVSAGGIKTDNLYYANGSPWDLQLPGGSNTQIQFNDADQFGGSSAFTFNKTSNLVSVTANLDANNLNATTHITAGNVYANSGTIGASLLTGTLTTASQPNVTSVGTLSSLTVSGNAGANNFNATTYVTAGNVYANSGTVGASLLTGTLTTASQPNVTSLGSLSSLTVTGNAGANNFNATTYVTAGNVYANSGTVGASLLTGTLTTASQPNVTSVGTLSSLDVTGNATAGNVYANSGTVGASLLTGTLTTASQPNVTSVGTLSSLTVTGNVVSGNVYANSGTVGASLLTGTLTTAAQPNVTSLGTLGSLAVTGNVTSGNVYANSGTIGAGTLKGEGGNISNIQGANVSGTVSSATTAGTVTTAAQPNITSVGTLTSLGVNGTVTAVAFTANTGVFTGNGSGLSAIAGANVTGQVGNALVAGTVYTAAQPNITSVGTLTSVDVTGNGVFGNVYANSGTIGAAQFKGDGGNLSNITAGNITGQVANALVAGTVYTAAQPNITSVGTLTSVAVTGNGTFGNVYANSGTIGAAQFKGDGGNLSNITAGNITGQVANALVAGTVYTAAQPNITSLGTLTGLGVNGTITGVNITANTGVFTGNANGLSSVQGANVVGTLNSTTLGNSTLYVGTTSIALNRASGAQSLTGITSIDGYASTVSTAAQPNITSVGTLTSLSVTGNVAAGNLTTTGVLSVTGTGVSSIAGNLDMTSNNIINLAEPVNASDAATKNYVDAAVTGLHVHDSCYVATTGTLDAASGGTVSYNNGSSGVGATLTTTGTYLLIDGGNVQTVGTRILVKNEANAAWNGIYTYTSTTVLTRATDFDTSAEAAGGDFVFVTSGTTQADTGWVQTTDNPTLGTSNIVWTQFSGAGTYSAGTGLTLTGTVFSITNTAVSAGTYGNGDAVAQFTVNGQGQLTAASNVSITANAGNLSGTTLKSTVVTSSLTAVGTVTTGIWNNNIGSSATFAAGLSGANLASITGGNVTGQVANALVAGTVYTAAQPNITSVGTLTSLTVTGNITGGNLIGPHANASSNVNIVQDGNINLVANAVTTMVVTKTGANITGTLNATGNANVGNIGGNNAVFTTFTGSGSGLTSIPAGNLTGTIPSAVLGASTVYVGTTGIALNRASAAQSLTGITSIDGYAATVSTAAQPNITSVGTLTSLSVSGATSVTGNSALTVTNLTSGANTTAGYLTGNWTLTTGSKLQSTYADLAEKYVADAGYEPGTVVIFGGEQEVTISTEHDSHRVAGVVSTNPAYIMNAACDGAHIVDLALQGRVPVKVHGPVAKGDLMVSGPNGHAVANNMARAGTIIGKALQNFSGDSGVIEIVVGRD